MLSRNELENLAYPDESKLDKYQIMGRNSSLARGGFWYGLLNHTYPIHWKAFCGVLKRTKSSSKNCDYPRGPEGFINFIVDIGDLPADMKSPTVGRKDHCLGYIKDNFIWQEAHENFSEAGLRSHLLNNNISKTHNSVSSEITKNILFSLKSDIYSSDLLKLTNRTCVRNLYYSVKELITEHSLPLFLDTKTQTSYFVRLKQCT